MMSRLIAIGDVHGCHDQLRIIMEEMICVKMGDKIVLLGDYIDRGPEIKKTIDYIIRLRETGFDLITLRGNHEMMMLHSFITGDFSAWFWNGGESTLESFGIDSSGMLDNVYMNFFEDLLWYHDDGKHLFVHAGFSDSDPFNDRNAMIWTRNEFYTNPLLRDKIIVHGHTPITKDECVNMVKSGGRVINIDTGCVYDDPGYRTLTAVELSQGEKKLWHAIR